jgi:hypothetical protein
VENGNDDEDNESNKKTPSTSPMMRALLQGMGLCPIKVIYGSYLKKVGSFIPSVRNRWFQFTDDGIIRYYTDQKCTKMKGEFHCMEILSMTELRNDNKFEWITYDCHKGKFEMQCETKEIYFRWKGFLTITGVLINDQSYSEREFYPNGKNGELTY